MIQAFAVQLSSPGVRIALTALVLPAMVYLGNPALALIAAAVLTLTLDRPLVDGASRVGKLSLQTAICGVTAIASLAPVVRSTAEQTAIVLAMVVLLNVIALLTFPWVGNGWD